ncbi:MAG: hypothetical protein IPO83_18140 [Chitinophagaceae bacterium]|nr:hypothetical protein [Chitinophagaceae bacterium]
MSTIRIYLEVFPFYLLAKIKKISKINSYFFQDFSLILVFLSFIFGLSQQTFGGTKIATANGNWGNPDTWNGDPQPTSEDTVIINSGITVTIAATAINDISSLIVNGFLYMDKSSSTNPTILNVLGDVTINSGGLIAGQSINSITNLIKISGDLTNHGTFTTKSGSDVIDVTFNGIALQNILGSEETNFNNLTIDNSAGVILVQSATVSETLFLINGTLSINASILTIHGSAPTRTLGKVNASNSSATIAFTNIVGITLPTALFTGSVNNLTMNCFGSASVSLLENITIVGILTFSNGIIATGSHSITVPAAGNIIRTSGHVNGNLVMGFDAIHNSRTFVIGSTSASVYTPVTLIINNITIGGNITAFTINGDHDEILTSGINENKSVNRSWTLTNSGIFFNTYDATFNFVAGDKDGSSNSANFVIRKYDGTGWLTTTIGIQGTSSTQCTGNISFSDFQIGETNPISTSDPPSTFVCIGGNASFTSTSNSIPAPLIQWQESSGGPFENISDGGIYSGTKNPTLTLTSVSAIMNGNKYHSVVTNINGSQTSADAILTVTPTVGIPTPIVVSLGVEPTCQVTNGTTQTTYSTTATNSTGFNWSINPITAGTIDPFQE